MRPAHWKIFVQHAHAVQRLANAIDRAAEHGLITERRADALIRETEEHENRFERLIARIEKAGIR